MDIKDAEPGMKVRYIPRHAGKNIYHPSCEDGIINSVGEVNIFVKYYIENTGILNTSAQSTSPEDLIIGDFRNKSNDVIINALSELEQSFSTYNLNRNEISWGVYESS